MLRKPIQRVANAPTPMAGLALGIASLGWCWENSGWFDGRAQALGAIIAAAMLVTLTLKFIAHPGLLKDDLAHPVVGSVVPTFAMATMVVSAAIKGETGQTLWLFAVALHLMFLVMFIWHRAKDFELHHMVPSWFVPPVGIIVADVTTPGGALLPLSHGLLWFGLSCYAVMLPIMLYRLIFGHEIPDAAKPTIAILAAPASLSLAGYLTVVPNPSLLLVDILLGIAVLMTVVIYLAFFRLLRLPFSPGYAAFTFPMVIGATALFKVADLFARWQLPTEAIAQIHMLAVFELAIATIVVGYVSLRYALHFSPKPKRQAAPSEAI